MSTEFLLTALVVVLIPGTGVVYTVSTGLFKGARASIFAAIGCTLGIVPHMAAGIAGIAVVLHMSALAFQVVKLAGVAYLLYLAWMTWREAGAMTVERSNGAESGIRTAIRGCLINILNPKLSLFFLAFLPQFIPLGHPAPTGQMLYLGLVFMLMTLVIFILYGFLAHGLSRKILSSPTISTWLQRGFAAVFAALGMKLAFAER